MSSEIELISDGDGVAVIGSASDVERFFLHSGLNRLPSRSLDLQRVWSVSSTAGSAGQVAADLAENSGRWVKLTKESAELVHKYGLMPTKDTPGVWHAMIGEPGDIHKWLQISKMPSKLLGTPVTLTALSTMMQQRAMQQQMDEIVNYLETLDEKVDDILRGQKDAVLADMIGVDLVIEDAFTIRDEVGRVSETTWSKVQATSQIVAKTQAYAIRELDAIAQKLHKKADLGEIARATQDAEPQVREWLAVLARTFQLQDAASVLELDRVLDSAPGELETHRLGVQRARQNRLERVGSTTSALLTQMDETIARANAKVLLNPFDAPAAVRSSTQVAAQVQTFRGRLGIEEGHETAGGKRWGQAAAELFDKARSGATDSAVAAKRLGEQTFDRATEAFRAVDLDGDGVPDQPRAAAAAEQAGTALKGAAEGVAGAFGTFFQRKRDAAVPPSELDAEPSEQSGS